MAARRRTTGMSGERGERRRPRGRRVRTGTAGVLVGAIGLVAAGCGSGSPAAVAAKDGPTTRVVAPPAASNAGGPVGTSSTLAIRDLDDIGRPITAEGVAAFGTGLRTTTGTGASLVAVHRPGTTPVVVADGTLVDGRPLRADDAFRVASVAKSFTAALALVLAHDGTVDLDTPIARWVDWPGGDRITTRDLLAHRAGVAPFGDADDDGVVRTRLLADAGHRYTAAEVLDATRGLPSSPPGERTTYRNLGYVLVGAVLEAATGRSLGDLMAERLFVPLGMARTALVGSGPVGPAPVPGRWVVADGTEPVPTTSVDLTATDTVGGGASAAVSTVDDLLRWTQAVLVDRRIAGVDVSAMSRIDAGGVGLGVLGVTPTGDCVFEGCPAGASFTRLAINGDAAGASTRILHDPASGTTLVVFLDRNGLDLDRPDLAYLTTVDAG